MPLVDVLRFITTHPLGRRNPVLALWKFAAWQISCRLRPGLHAVDWISPAKLNVRRGMTGATGNIYVGLHEFEEMGFLLHLLRETDDFIDVGANVGSYTMLASSVVGARSIALEPIPSTYAHLRGNIRLNSLDCRVAAHNVGVAADEGELVFSMDLDTVNHVLSDVERSAASPFLRVPVLPLSKIVGGCSPILVKIDVEGFETEVIRGGGDLWTRSSLAAVTMELNGSGRRYGFDDLELDARMRALGFGGFKYDPFHRSLEPVSLKGMPGGNMIYIRDLELVRMRVENARKFTALGVSF